MWKYIGEGRTIAGAPAEDLTDEEFAAAEARLDAQFAAAGSLSACQHPEAQRAAEAGHACLLYQHVDDGKAGRARRSGDAGDAASAPAGGEE